MCAARAHHLPLRHLVDGVDVIHALDPIQVSLMHGVDTQITGPASRLRLAPLPIATCTARVLV